MSMVSIYIKNLKSKAMKNLLFLLLIASSFIIFSCKRDSTQNKEKIERHKEKIENKGFGGVKTEPSRSTVVSDDSVAAENPNEVGKTTGNTNLNEEGTTTSTTSLEGNTTSGTSGDLP